MSTKKILWSSGIMGLCLVLALFFTGCGTMGSSSSGTFHAGPFTMQLPPSFKAVPVPATNSYVGAFESPNVYLTFDYGMSANNFEDWPAATEFELVMIDGKEARIGTLPRGFRPGYNFSTQVAFRDTGSQYLTITAACKTRPDCDRAKKIFQSIKFKPSTRDD